MDNPASEQNVRQEPTLAAASLEHTCEMVECGKQWKGAPNYLMSGEKALLVCTECFNRYSDGI